MNLNPVAFHHTTCNRLTAITFAEHIHTLQMKNLSVFDDLMTLSYVLLLCCYITIMKWLQCLTFVYTYFSTEIAVSPNNNVVNIYQKKGKDWVKIHELTEHNGRITGTVTYISQQ